MGAGLSMASVNKIKELANSREYSLALELVEHQDLSKSLNPQFLRLCGEIYIKNDRYEDARKCLIMAHRLAPESKRIMYVFVELYLRMGYFELAKKYYDMYMFDAGSYDSRQMEYVWTKHEHPDALKDMEQLLASYLHNLDYDWSFELYLVYKKDEKQEEAHSLAELYEASFKNSENSDRIREIEKGNVSADACFDVYASEEKQDDDERYEELRREETELLAADDLRMHPKEAEITVMYEDAFTPAGSEKKVQKMLKKQDREEERKEKKLLKEQRKQEKKLEKQAAKAENSKEEPEQEAAKPEAVEAAAAETAKSETVEVTAEVVKPEVVETAAAEERKPETVEVTEAEVEPETTEETAAEEVKPETATEEVKSETAEEASNLEAEDKAVGEETEEPESEKNKKKGFFGKLFHKKQEEEEAMAEYAELLENSETEKEAEPEAVHTDPEAETSKTIDTMTTGQADDMRHKSKTMAKDVVIVDDDDDFEPEADTIEELAAKENSESDIDKKVEAKKPTFEFQTVELAPDDFEDQFEVDDFSDKLDAEFGEMRSYEPEAKIEEEPEVTEEPEPEIEEEPEVAEEPEPEPEIKEEPEVSEEPEPEIKEEPEVAEEPEPEIEEEPEFYVAPFTTKPEIEEEPEVSEEPEPEIEEEPEVAEEPEIEEEPEVAEEPEPEIEEEPEFYVAPFTTKPEKKKLDFPVFKSSLFPDYHKEVKNVENNFNEIMEEAQDKMTENMRKEAQMQKEAEELLASLGISLDSIPAPKAVKEEQPKQQGPSRDELKASLKIDTNKKNLLKRIKEYR